MSHSICIVYITCEMPAVEKGSLMQPMLDHDRCRQTAGFFGKALFFCLSLTITNLWARAHYKFYISATQTSISKVDSAHKASVPYNSGQLNASVAKDSTCTKFNLEDAKHAFGNWLISYIFYFGFLSLRFTLRSEYQTIFCYFAGPNIDFVWVVACRKTNWSSYHNSCCVYSVGIFKVTMFLSYWISMEASYFLLS